MADISNNELQRSPEERTKEITKVGIAKVDFEKNPLNRKPVAEIVTLAGEAAALTFIAAGGISNLVDLQPFQQESMRYAIEWGKLNLPLVRDAGVELLEFVSQNAKPLVDAAAALTVGIPAYFIAKDVQAGKEVLIKGDQDALKFSRLDTAAIVRNEELSKRVENPTINDL